MWLDTSLRGTGQEDAQSVHQGGLQPVMSKPLAACFKETTYLIKHILGKMAKTSGWTNLFP